MPRFCFHMHKGTRQVRDEHGWDFTDLVAAARTAIEGIRAIVAEDALSGFIDLNGYVEVADEQGEVLVTIRFTDAVAISVQPPAGVH